MSNTECVVFRSVFIVRLVFRSVLIVTISINLLCLSFGSISYAEWTCHFIAGCIFVGAT